MASRAANAAILVLAAALAGCGSTRNVVFAVDSAESGRGVSPVRAAHVRVVTLDRGAVPLPLSKKTIDELFTGELPTSGFTDERGRVKLELASTVPHLVEVIPPPVGPDADGSSRTVWVLGVDGRTLELMGRESIGARLGLRIE